MNIAADINQANRDLVEAGFTRDQAEAFTNAVCTLNAGLATKSDLAALENRMASDRVALEDKLTSDLDAREERLKAEIEKSHSALELKIERATRTTLYQMIVLFLALISLPVVKDNLPTIFG